MGWTYTYKGKKESIKDFFRRKFDYEREDGRYGRVVDCAVVGLRTAYIAYETGDAAGSREVSAVVCLLDYRPHDCHNFGYKDMSETMHPFCYDCPERILRLLTPTDSESANRWREKCWENVRARKARPRLAKGVVIEFDEPVVFSSGFEERTFRVVDPRRLIFEDAAGWRRCRLRRSTLRERPWKVLEA